MKKLNLFIAFLLLPLAAWSGSKTGADFLKIPVGARGVALGQANSALSQGVDSLNWNPAGIATTPNYAGNPKAGFSFSHQSLFLDSNLDQIGLVIPSRINKRPLTWGLSVTRLSHPDQEGRAADRSVTGSFGTSDLAIGTALGTMIGRIQLGTQVKLIRQELAEFEAQGTAVDFGFMAPTPISRLSVGGSVRNLGPKMQFITEEFNLPLTLSLGAAYQLTGPLLLGFDVNSRPYEDQVSFAMGTEFQALQSITLRAGYLAKLAEAITSNQTTESSRGNVGGLEGMTAGLGIQLKEFSLDYAFSQFGELGFTHSFTIATWFGGQPVQQPLVLALPPVEPITPVRTIVVKPVPIERVLIFFDLPVVDEKWWINPAKF